MRVKIKKGDKVNLSGYDNRIFIIQKHVGVLGVEKINGIIRPKSYYIIEDFHDKSTPKKKGHLTLKVRVDEEYKIKLI